MLNSPFVGDSPDFIDERMKVYEEWIHTAGVRQLHNLKYNDN
jgi:hypothetical protein